MSQPAKQVVDGGLSRSQKAHVRRKVRHDTAQKRKGEVGVSTDGSQEKKVATKSAEPAGRKTSKKESEKASSQKGTKGVPSPAKAVAETQKASQKGTKAAKAQPGSTKSGAKKGKKLSGNLPEAANTDGKSKNQPKGAPKAQSAPAVPVGAKKLAAADSSVSVMKPVVGPDAVTLFIGNLPFATSTEDIRLIFDNDAGIQHVRMVQRANKTGKGFGFVLVRNQADADRLLKLKNGTVIEGRPITVQVSGDQGSRTGAGAGPDAESDAENDHATKSKGAEKKAKRGKDQVAAVDAVSDEAKLSRRQFKLLKAQQKEAEDAKSGPAARDMAVGTVLGKRFKGKQIKLGDDEADADDDVAAQPPAKKAKKQATPQPKQKPAAKKAAPAASESDDDSDEAETKAAVRSKQHAQDMNIDDDDSDDEPRVPVGKPTKVSKASRAVKASSDSDDD